ncbi:acyltransferase family protein, partial [Streptomyces hainanensis]
MTQSPREPRNRYVDLVRITAVCFVCMGHWLVTDISYRGGRLHGVDALDQVPWTHWLTLLFQVMPPIFLAGGYANAVSWSAHRRRDAWGGWLGERARGLLVPTAVYVAAATVAVAVCLVVGVDGRVLSDLGWAMALHLWFLPLYLLLLALTPPLFALHRRLGLRLVALFVAVAAVVNVLVLVPGVPLVGWLNYLLVWGGMYLLGFAWHDGELGGIR